MDEICDRNDLEGRSGKCTRADERGRLPWEGAGLMIFIYRIEVLNQLIYLS